LNCDLTIHEPRFIRYLLRVQFRKITIVGVGLLGGSIGLAARQRKLAGEVAGYVRRAASLKDCETAGAVDYATTDLLAAVSNADLIILCTPLAQMRALAKQILPALKRGAIVTDVGSVKATVVRELESIISNAGAQFIGSHPMAGAEKTGVSAARKNLFENAVCVLTPTKKNKFCRDQKTGTILEIARRADAAAGRGATRFTRQPHEPSAAHHGGGVGEPGSESGQPENAGGALCDRFSRHDAHRIRLAGNVARHRAGEP